MTRQILAADLGLAHIDGALVRIEKPKKAPKPLRRGGPIARRTTPSKKPSTPEQRAIERNDRAFSKAIRTRDCPQGWGKCITCGKLASYAKMDCGHYLGRQYFATRWDPMNCAAQCRTCNRFNEGLKAKFRVALVKKYGEKAIQRMEALHKTGRKPDLLQLQLIRDEIRDGKRTEAPDAA